MCGATPAPTMPSGAGSYWLPASVALHLHRASTSTCSSLCLITGGMASRLCVNTASCRPWAGPNSRVLGQPQPRRRPTWRWMWAASTGADRWLAWLDSGHEEWGPVGRAGRAAQGFPETEVLLHCGCRRARGRQGRPQSGVWEQLGLRLGHSHQTGAPGTCAQSG
uniref:Uncharacterized protein n=1 Tax=Panthera tigris altaica TaxID=74533 RepID=A0A8C9KEV6_PANTA